MSTQYGLIGYPIAHSQSPMLFQKQFGKAFDYLLLPIEQIGQISTIIKENPNLLGFNVTHPYKESIFPYLDEVDESAQIIGAVNTVSIERSNRRAILKGYNTDYLGFQRSIKEFILESIHDALILGTGGAAKSIAYALTLCGIHHQLITHSNVKDALPYSELTTDHIRNTKLIINATPLGMFPHQDECPEIPYEAISNTHYLFDAIYNPEETLFLHKGKENGAHTRNGYCMLKYQAEESWKIWGLI